MCLKACLQFAFWHARDGNVRHWNKSFFRQRVSYCKLPQPLPLECVEHGAYWMDNKKNTYTTKPAHCARLVSCLVLSDCVVSSLLLHANSLANTWLKLLLKIQRLMWDSFKKDAGSLSRTSQANAWTFIEPFEGCILANGSVLQTRNECVFSPIIALPRIYLELKY